MADNKTLTTTVATVPSGTVLASDEIGGVDYPRGKIGLGDNGTAVDWVGGSGVVGTNTARVVLATDVALPAGTNAIGKLAANAGVTIGAVEIAAAQTLATVTTVSAVTAISNALPAGTNAIGKLAANTGVDIGDVDVTSIVPGTAATNLGKAEDAAHASGDTGVMALAVRVDTEAAQAGTSGDYIPLITNATGSLRTVTGTYGAQVEATLTRPADTTAYAAGDEVSSSTSAPVILTFTGAARVSGGTGLIVGATMRDSNYTATEGGFELWLFDTTHTPDNDNAAFFPTDGEVDTVIAGGPIQFYYKFNGDTTAGATGNMLYVASGGPWPFLTVGSANLFGRIVVRNAYTPISAETFRVRLLIQQD